MLLINKINKIFLEYKDRFKVFIQHQQEMHWYFLINLNHILIKKF